MIRVVKKLLSYKSIMANQKGYTIIELLFAVANFAFIIMIAISAFVAAMKVYNKSNTARQTQQVARSIVEQIQRDVKYGSLFDVPAGAGFGEELCIRTTSSLVHYRIANNEDTDPNQHRFIERAELNNPSETANCLPGDGVDDFSAVTYIRLNPPNVQLLVHSLIRDFDGPGDENVNFSSSDGRPLFIFVFPQNFQPGMFIGQGSTVWIMFSLSSYFSSNDIVDNDPFFDQINIFTVVNVRKGNN